MARQIMENLNRVAEEAAEMALRVEQNDRPTNFDVLEEQPFVPSPSPNWDYSSYAIAGAWPYEPFKQWGLGNPLFDNNAVEVPFLPPPPLFTEDGLVPWRQF